MANYTTLRRGNGYTEENKRLQQALKDAGYGSYLGSLGVDGVYGSGTESAVRAYQQANNLQVDGIAGDETLGRLYGGNQSAQQTTPQTAQTQTSAPVFSYTPSGAVTQAEALLQQQLAQKPGDYQSTWAGQLNDTIAQILNREKLSYDVNEDALYQQYADQYVTQGKLAMMDAMGQAASLTGGYTSSAAQAVGQQAYQAYLQKLNEVVPELYSMARDQHNQEGQALYDQASLLAGMDEQEYGRYQDKLNQYFTELNYLTENARYMSETEYQKALDAFNIKYGAYRDTVGDQQWQAQFDEAKRQYDEQMALSKSKSSGGSGGGGGSYDADAAKKQQELVDAGFNIAVDGIWGPKSQAAWEEYQSGGGITETEATKAFEKKLHPESQHDAIARQMYGSYKSYVDKQIQSALKNGEITENEATWLYSKYRIYD